MEIEELKIEGRNAVLEAFRSGRTIDKLFVLDGCKDGPVQSIIMTILNLRKSKRMKFAKRNLRRQSKSSLSMIILPGD